MGENGEEGKGKVPASSGWNGAVGIGALALEKENFFSDERHGGGLDC